MAGRLTRSAALRGTLGAAAVVVAGGSVAIAPTPAAAATDDELAYAHFGLAAEFLLKDYYAKLAGGNLVSGVSARDVSRGALNAAEHATALTELLADAGQTAAVKEDFDFVWPDGTFASGKSAAAAGLTVARTLLGVYIGAAAVISITSYRQLYASMAANVAQQVAALSQLAGGRLVGISFPSPLDLETASDIIEDYLG